MNFEKYIMYYRSNCYLSLPLFSIICSDFIILPGYIDFATKEVVSPLKFSLFSSLLWVISLVVQKNPFHNNVIKL